MIHNEDKSMVPPQNVLFKAQLNSAAKRSPPRPSNTGEALAELKKKTHVVLLKNFVFQDSSLFPVCEQIQRAFVHLSLNFKIFIHFSKISRLWKFYGILWKFQESARKFPPWKSFNLKTFTFIKIHTNLRRIPASLHCDVMTKAHQFQPWYQSARWYQPSIGISGYTFHPLNWFVYKLYLHIRYIRSYTTNVLIP